ILLQAPNATRVGGYRRWQSLGRQVRKGERGIAIFAPCVYRARPLDDDEAAGAPELARVLRGFRIAHVWDESQTDGDPLPDVRPQLLAGEAPAGLWDGLAREVADAGYELTLGQCGGANGRTSYATRTVTVRDDVDDAQATRTLMHELAHVWLHDPDEALHHRGVAEVEAESTAYVVCQAAGMVTDGYSLPYVARWSGGDPEKVRLTAERVIGASRRALIAVGIAQGREEAEPVPA
ncbi:MAG: ArdC-like ssDNA-binding domain-containing protein, partial [Acidimicrobiales bacterium]